MQAAVVTPSAQGLGLGFRRHLVSAGQLPGCQFATGPPLRARLPCLQARRRPVEDDDEQASSSGGRAGGFSFERRADNVRVSFGQTQIQVPDQTLWLTALAVIGLGVVIGPIVAAVAMLTMSLAVAASVGAFAISTMFLPMVIFMLMFGGFFGSFALLGVGLVFPQLVSMVVAGGALALGWSLVRSVLPTKPAPKQSKSKQASRPAAQPVIDVDPEEEEAKREARRVQQELRDFDALLADKERRNRMQKDRWS